MENLEIEVLIAARNMGIGMILFRNSLAKNLKLNLTESLCLTLLGVKGHLSPSELSRLIGLRTGSITTMLDRLEKKDFICRSNNPKDRRGIFISLTEKYKKDSKALVKNIQKDHRELINSYSKDELPIILDFLQKITLNMMNNASDVRYLFLEPVGTYS